MAAAATFQTMRLRKRKGGNYQGKERGRGEREWREDKGTHTGQRALFQGLDLISTRVGAGHTHVLGGSRTFFTTAIQQFRSLAVHWLKIEATAWRFSSWTSNSVQDVALVRWNAVDENMSPFNRHEEKPSTRGVLVDDNVSMCERWCHFGKCSSLLLEMMRRSLSTVGGGFKKEMVDVDAAERRSEMGRHCVA